MKNHGVAIVNPIRKKVEPSPLAQSKPPRADTHYEKEFDVDLFEASGEHLK